MSNPLAEEIQTHSDALVTQAHIWTRYYLVRQMWELQEHSLKHHRYGMCDLMDKCPYYRHYEMNAMFLRGTQDEPLMPDDGRTAVAFRFILSLPTSYQRMAPWRDAEKELYTYNVVKTVIIGRRILGFNMLGIGTTVMGITLINMYVISIALLIIGITAAVLVNIGGIYFAFPQLYCQSIAHSWAAIFETEGALHYCARCGEVQTEDIEEKA